MAQHIITLSELPPSIFIQYKDKNVTKVTCTDTSFTVHLAIGETHKWRKRNSTWQKVIDHK